MSLETYLQGMRRAQTAEELEAALQAPFPYRCRGRTWETICRVRREAGNRIVAAHPHGFYVPQVGERRRLTCCGETYRVGYGQNGTGERYVWHAAGQWAMRVLRERGFGIRAAYRLWDGHWYDYPHRSISLVESILAGKVPDPKLDVLVNRFKSTNPIAYTVEQNNACAWSHRPTRPCRCGGTRFDWGGGYSDGFEFVNWHCNKCRWVYTQYMASGGLRKLRCGEPKPTASPATPAQPEVIT